MITVTFNGNELTQHFHVLGIDRELLPSRENYSIESEFRHGKDYDGFKYSERVIKVQVAMIAVDSATLQSAKRSLARLLYVDKPAQLTFSDEPDKYYMAIPDGSTDMDQLLGVGTVELTFACYDPFAYSTEETTATNDGNAVLTVPYAGSYPVYPTLEATLTSKSSLVAFITQSGKILQFGDPSLDDTQIVQQSEVLLNVRSMSQSLVSETGWKVNAEQFPNILMDGRYLLPSLPITFYGYGAGVTQQSKGTERKYNGTSFSRDLPADSNGHMGASNFAAAFSTRYETGKIFHTGINRLELRDANDKHVCGVTFYKSAISNNNALVYITVNNNVVHSRGFQPTAWNPYTSAGKSFSISKFGSKFTFRIGNIAEGGFVFDFDLTELSATEVTKIVHYTGAWAGTENLMANTLSTVSFTKHAVDKVVDAPTLFSQGDVITADTSKGIVYVNGQENLNLDTLGNQWESFFLSPGDNEITIIPSDFATMPDVQIKYRERWL